MRGGGNVLKIFYLGVGDVNCIYSLSRVGIMW